MPQSHGSCGHKRSDWDNHKRCLSCCGCSRDQPCAVSRVWKSTTWDRAEKRKTYKSRSSSTSKSSRESSLLPEVRSLFSESPIPPGDSSRDKASRPPSADSSLAPQPQGNVSVPTLGASAPTLGSQGEGNGSLDRSGKLQTPDRSDPNPVLDRPVQPDRSPDRASIARPDRSKIARPDRSKISGPDRASGPGPDRSEDTGFHWEPDRESI